MSAVSAHTAAAWAARLAALDPDTLAGLRNVYGADREVIEDRVRLLRRTVDLFLLRFGDRPVRLFRAPGRLNLRGMHVDTHGGYLNLMTHQREVVMAAALADGPVSTFVNVDPAREEVAFDLAGAPAANGRDWLRYIADPALQRPPHPPRGHWGRYAEGCALRVRYAFPDAPLRGLLAAVGGDIPEGAALSSSAAFCVAGVSAFLAGNGLALDPAALILAARDAEWHAGSRCGVSDQAAIVLGGPGEVVNVALYAAQLDVSGARRVAMPPGAVVLVANSYTRRSLSGAQHLEYTRNRFAYSLALEVLRHELRADGTPSDVVDRLDRLSRFTSEAIPGWDDPRTAYRLLARVPEEIALAGLRDRYDFRNLDEVYEQYFSSLPDSERPDRFHLRGPLLFGLAESERARVFPDLLERGDVAGAGRLMRIGHDGDRRVTPAGAPYHFSVTDAALRRYAGEGRSLVECPGAYGAGSPVLDALVDTAVNAGAVGACLTGAGMAGAVLTLCRAAVALAVAAALRARMSAPDYAALAGLDAPLTAAQLADAVVHNQATAANSELRITNYEL